MRIFGLNIGKDKAADYTGAPGSEERRAAHKEMHPEAGGAGFADPDADVSYETGNAGEPARERYYGEQAEPHHVQRSPGSMGRQPYSWHGVDRDGNAKSGQTLMRDKTVPAMVRGFWDVGYQQLQVTRDGTGAVGGITPAKGFPGAMPWHEPVSTQTQREP